MIYILAALIGLLIYCFFSIKEKYRYFEKRGIAHTKPTFLLGNIWKGFVGLENMGVSINRMYTEYPDEPMFGIYSGLTPIFVLRDPELVAKVMTTDFSHFYNRGTPYNDEVNPLEGNLANVDGYKWKILRTVLSPTFTSGKIKGMLPLIEKCAETFIQDLDNHLGEQIEMKMEFSKMAAHIIGSCAFGIETDAIRNPDSDFIKLGVQMADPGRKEFFYFIVRFVFPSLDKYLRLVTIKPEVTEFFTKLVKDVFEHRKRTGYSRNDFIQLLLELREKGEVAADNRDTDENNLSDPPKPQQKLVLTDNVLTAQAAIFMVAGFETISTALSYICYFLSKHQDVQERLRQEVRQITVKFGGISYESLKDMTYLEAVMNESLRLLPPVSFLARSCTKDGTECGGVSLNKGSMIIIPVLGMQMDSNYYPDPEVFKPERFFNTTPVPYTFLPFGAGPRSCIGDRFARLEVKLTLAKMMLRYRLDTCPKMAAVEPIKIKPTSIVNTPNDGIFCIVNKIE